MPVHSFLQKRSRSSWRGDNFRAELYLLARLDEVGLRDFELRIENLFESTFAKASRRGVEPVEIAKRVIREVDQNTLSGAKYALAPNVIEVSLSPADYANLEPVMKSIKAELLVLLKEHAAGSDMRFVGPLSLDVLLDQEQKFGSIIVECGFDEDSDYQEKMVLRFEGGSTVVLGEALVSVGRMPGSTVVIEDPKVSRAHAELFVTDQRAFVRDLGSTNGTFVNGVRIKDVVELKDGDQIVFGRTQGIFEVQ